jgi:hypothetical protein
MRAHYLRSSAAKEAEAQEARQRLEAKVGPASPHRLVRWASSATSPSRAMGEFRHVTVPCDGRVPPRFHHSTVPLRRGAVEATGNVREGWGVAKRSRPGAIAAGR